MVPLKMVSIVSALIRPAYPLTGTKSIARAHHNQTWTASAVEEDPEEVKLKWLERDITQGRSNLI